VAVQKTNTKSPWLLEAVRCLARAIQVGCSDAEVFDKQLSGLFALLWLLQPYASDVPSASTSGAGLTRYGKEANIWKSEWR